MTTTMTTIDAKERFIDLINHVAQTKDRVILTRRGNNVVAIVPLEDLEFLEATQDKADLNDAMDAYKEAKESELTSLEKIKQELGE